MQAATIAGPCPHCRRPIQLHDRRPWELPARVAIVQIEGAVYVATPEQEPGRIAYRLTPTGAKAEGTR